MAGSTTINVHTIFPLELTSSYNSTHFDKIHTMVGTKLVALGYVVLLSIGLTNATRVARYSTGSAKGTGGGGGEGGGTVSGGGSGAGSGIGSGVSSSSGSHASGGGGGGGGGGGQNGGTGYGSGSGSGSGSSQYSQGSSYPYGGDMVDTLALAVPVAAVVEGKLVVIEDLVDMGLVVALVPALQLLLTIGIDKVVQMLMLVEMVVAMAEEEMVGVVRAKVLDLGMAMPTPSSVSMRNLKK
ncbi:hypothetical protein ZWY2020_027053 [Hordeum vulgare]|nr:hypothetical protein ZWY2020_027053 [Hordeum vulgare]